MTFLDYLKICMVADASVNALVTGCIKYGEIPVDSPLTNDYITFNKTLTESIDTTDYKGAVQKYSVEIQCMSSSADRVVLLADTMDNYLEAYDDKNIRNFNKESGGALEFNPEKKLHYITTVYNVLFSK
jgi:antitoxin component of RelBE/YafQ-DinJ toxin-antitoxin module